MARSLSRWLVGSLCLAQLACKRPGGQQSSHAVGGDGPRAPSSSVGNPSGAADARGVVTGSSALHPALGGHPPSYWREQGQRPSSDEAPVPDEAWGRRFRYRTHLRGVLGSPCLCQDRSGACVAGPVVRGLTWSSIPWARNTNGQPEATVELVGVLSPGAFTLAEPPRRPAPVNEEETLLHFPMPCESPSLGWQIREPGRVGSEDEQSALTYAEKQAEHGGTWIHWDPSLTRAERARSPMEKGVLVFTFTENLDPHRRNLERLWGGPLCVASAEMTTETQGAIVARAADLLRREGRRHGLLCGSFGVSSDNSNGRRRVSVSALAWDTAKLSRWLSDALAGFPVEVSSPLVAEPAP